MNIEIFKSDIGDAFYAFLILFRARKSKLYLFELKARSSSE